MTYAAAAAPTGPDLLLSEGVILLAAALAFVILFRRLGLGAVLGYLIAGALVGPYGLGLIGDGQSKLAIAEIGIVLLLFLVGLELSPARLWRLKRDIFGLGLAQVALCGLAIAAIIFFFTGFTGPAALALGLPLALSSTAQALPGLKSSGRINSPFGEKAFSILLFQDLAIVPLITIIAALSRAPANPDAPPGWQMALYTIGAVAALVIAGRFLVRPLLGLVGRLGERELFVAVGLFTVLAAAAFMHMLHLSTALGAFVAGVMLADSPYRHEIESDVEPFRTILLGLFFVAVGMLLDLGAIARAPLFVFGMALVLVVTKVVVISLVARLFGMEMRAALALGLLLSQGGEFAFVLFGAARDALLVHPVATTMFSAVVTLSMMTTPFLLAIARRLEHAPSDDRHLDGPDGTPGGGAIVIGYGRFGQTVAQMLTRHGTPVTLIDRKPAQIDMAGQMNVKVYYGDGTRVDLLRLAGAEDASVIAFCHDDRAFGEKALRPIMEAFPQAAILTRVYDRRQVIALEDMGLAAVQREVFESAIAMARIALSRLGLDDAGVADIEARYRRNDRQRLDLQKAEGSILAARHLLWKPGKGIKINDEPLIGDDA